MLRWFADTDLGECVQNLLDPGLFFLLRVRNSIVSFRIRPSMSAETISVQLVVDSRETR